MLAERLADAHGRGAFDLAFDGDGVNWKTDVVHGDVFQYLQIAGVGVDFDDAGVCRERLRAAVGFFLRF